MTQQSVLMNAVLEHSRFFDRLVNGIPAKYYVAGADARVGNDDDDDDAQQATAGNRFQRQKPSEKAERKKKMKEQSREAKRRKLDPSRCVTAIEAQTYATTTTTTRRR